MAGGDNEGAGLPFAVPHPMMMWVVRMPMRIGIWTSRSVNRSRVTLTLLFASVRMMSATTHHQMSYEQHSGQNA